MRVEAKLYQSSTEFCKTYDTTAFVKNMKCHDFIYN